MTEPTKAEPKNPFGSTRLRHHHVLLLLVLIALVVRVVFLNGRWINPDEGAHLMDGWLVLEGFVPVADYQSRQVFYTYTLAFLLRVVGVSYEAARFYPVLATVGIGVLTYLIAARLFNRRVALLSAAIYLFLPLTIAYGTTIKTEPLTILLSCLGLYALLVALDRNQSLAFFTLAGLCFGLAYYVRQSSLALLLASVIVLVVALRRPRPVLRASAAMFGGFAVVCAAVLALYATLLPIPQALTHKSLNPAAFVVNTTRPAWQALMGSNAPLEPAAQTRSSEVRESGAGRSARPQPLATTLRNIRQTANLHSFLLVSLFLSPFFLLRHRGEPVHGGKEHDLRGATLLYSWLGAVGLAYAFYAVVRGFFVPYFAEFLPPLAILTAVVALAAFRGIRRDLAPARRDLAVLAVLVLAVLTLQAAPMGINRPFYYLAVPPVFALIYLGGPVHRRHLAAFAVLAAAAVAILLLDGVVRGMVGSLVYLSVLFFLVFGALFAAWRVDPRKQPAFAGAFVSYSLLVSTGLLGLAPSLAPIDRTFGGAWSHETVSEVATYVRQNTGPDDEVISGAVIWEFEANRRPFMLRSHPLSLSGGDATPDVRRTIEEGLRQRPPAIVILDGYTERTYGEHVPLFGEMLNTHYRLDRVVEGSRYPVKIYRLNPPLGLAP